MLLQKSFLGSAVGKPSLELKVQTHACLIKPDFLHRYTLAGPTATSPKCKRCSIMLMLRTQASNGSRTVMKGAANKLAGKAKSATKQAASKATQSAKKVAKKAPTSPPKGARKTVRQALLQLSLKNMPSNSRH